jgi:DNA-binding GntR family transcriptional regulator
VRETLLLLEREALVRHDAHRGARVASPSLEDVADIFEVRGTLEAEGLRRVAKGGLASLTPLRNAVEALEMVAARGEWDRFADSEAAFHQALVDALASPRLSSLQARVLGELRLVLIGIDCGHEPAGPPPSHISEHRAIVELLEEGRFGEASALLHQHLDEAAELVTRYLRSRQAPLGT